MKNHAVDSEQQGGRKMIIKRTGKLAHYERSKVINAISKAMFEVIGDVDVEVCNTIVDSVETALDERGGLHVEDIQDIVELELMTVYPAVAKAYILYRDNRTKKRNAPWELDDLQKQIFNSKYKFENESFNDFILRVSNYNNEVAKLIRNQDFVFAGRILAGRGLDRNMSLSNCYVLPQPEDNIESIFDTAKELARTYSYGGGAGFDISKLRPAGDKVNNAAVTTSGPVSFMELYDTTTAVIGQRGRRGALMLSMGTEHPDINDFINAKEDLKNLNHANISVRATDEFFHLDTESKKETLDLIAKNNWNTGEPGMLFWDKIQDYHLLSEHPDYKITSTNPCAEQPLPDYGNCLLGSINLSNFVIDEYKPTAKIDYERLIDAIRVAVVGLNEVLVEGIVRHPLEQQRQQVLNFRQIGLGIMGLADMFIKLGVKYGDNESLEISHDLGQLFLYTAIDESVLLAKEFGPYDKYNFEHISRSKFFKLLPDYMKSKIEKHGMRNSHVLSIAPTGSISTLFGVSGGIEPIFANYFTRTTKSLEGRDVKYKVYNKTVEKLIDEDGNLPDYCVTSHDIKPIDRIKIQAVWQKYVDSAISSTINLSEETTVDDIKKIYVEAWAYGLKGVTVFRDGCKRLGILTTDDCGGSG